LCLHNFIRIQDIGVNEYVTENMIDQEGPDGLIESSWRRNIDNNFVFQKIGKCSTNNTCRIVAKIRNNFCEYFNSEGVIPWQFNHC